MKNEIIEITTQEVERRLISLRGQRVLLDRDVAELYGVQTKEINQAVKNNPRKFRQGYIFELNEDEKKIAVKNFDHKSAISSMSRYAPKAFTEKGLYMLATIRWRRSAAESASEDG